MADGKHRCIRQRQDNGMQVSFWWWLIAARIDKEGIALEARPGKFRRQIIVIAKIGTCDNRLQTPLEWLHINQVIDVATLKSERIAALLQRLEQFRVG